MNHKHAYIAVLLLATLAASVFAAPGVPHQFYGDVTINGQAAPDNLFVEAKINGGIVGTTPTKNGKYGHQPYIFYVEDPNSLNAGKKIEFFVAGVKGGERTFSNGASTKLDLTITCSDCLPSTGGGSSGSGTSGGSSSSSSGGGGGGGGGSILAKTTGSISETTTPEETTPEEPSTTTTEKTTESVASGVCAPDWICSEWTECSNGVKKRVCVDKHDCGSEENKPGLKEDCALTDEELFGNAPGEKPPLVSRITGAVVGGGWASWVSLIALIAIIAGLFTWHAAATKSAATKKHPKR